MVLRQLLSPSLSLYSKPNPILRFVLVFLFVSPSFFYKNVYLKIRKTNYIVIFNNLKCICIVLEIIIIITTFTIP